MILRAVRRWRRRRLLARHAIADADWQAAVHAEACLRTLTQAERVRLRELATLFVAGKSFFGAAGFEVGPVHAARIAAVAALPVLELGIDWYSGWHSIIVYPSGFLARHQQPDPAGIVHDTQRALIGEAWDIGPVVFSWSDIEAGGRGDGYNVVLHELAHKLDMLDGASNGIPPLHPEMVRPQWTTAFSDCFDDIRGRIAAGRRTPVDAYAAEAPAECFAVVTEAFFECPQTVAEAYPAVYAQLAAFYRQDPLRRHSMRRGDHNG
ncbi:MAG TPA: M90 family metallopeptidase [Gammaproteobacteria bacterium]|nr:M90 family metallopeptidase [Gammaproteobacteria bacterium]